jgi:hypothetical protein
MLPQREPELNGIRISHDELRALHAQRLLAIRSATIAYCLDGPRLLSPDLGETCSMYAHERDRDGALRASVVVQSASQGWRYARRVRLVRSSNSVPDIET